MQAATHSGKFHADDVLAWAMLSLFLEQKCTLIRTRDPEILQRADIVFDVGGEYNVQNKRFDHHQNDYQGPLSSAGMILHWLFQEGNISDKLYIRLKSQIVDYVDDVDNGRRQPDIHVPCFTQIVESLNKNVVSNEDFDSQFLKAAHLASLFLNGIVQEEIAAQEAETLVLLAMKEADKQACSLLEFPKYLSWKGTYFANGGQEEAIFCHKNRFIAVFKTRDGAIRALKRFNLLSD